MQKTSHLTLSPGLYIVATPIGNLKDISLRALEVLQAVDRIACEDSRVTGKLLSHYSIKTPTFVYHDHNAATARPKILQFIANGEAVALVTDAGTPLISDPGYKLLCAVREAGHYVTSLPGACAPIMALTLSGLPSDRFLFAGFLPNKTAARKKVLQTFIHIDATLLFFESPKRLAASLSDMEAVFGNRPAAISRELTKLYEETRSGSLQELAEYYAEHGPPKGEIVIIVGPPPQSDAISLDDARLLLTQALASSSVNAAVREVADITGIAKNTLYSMALELKGRP